VVKKSKRFDPFYQLSTVLERTWKITSDCHISGEGWFYTTNFFLCLDLGINNIICTVPFDCMPIHYGCRGAINKVKKLYPELNTCVLDFDAGFFY
jgi:predicted nucleotide-binding protein (sugar kinase/HSP70/actin superfamily)